MECLKGFDKAQDNVEYLHNFISFGISTRDYNQFSQIESYKHQKSCTVI